MIENIINIESILFYVTLFSSVITFYLIRLLILMKRVAKTACLKWWKGKRAKRRQQGEVKIIGRAYYTGKRKGMW